MELKIEQRLKELYSADFNIIENDSVVGNIHVSGSALYPIPVSIKIQFKDQEILMNYNSKGITDEQRLYKITRNNNEYGSTYEKKQKTGFLSYVYYQMLETNGKEYQLGYEGAGECQLEGVTKTDKGYDVIIYDELYNYIIKCSDDMEEAVRSIILTAYKYGIAHFNPGEKITKGKRCMHFPPDSKN